MAADPITPSRATPWDNTGATAISAPTGRDVAQMNNTGATAVAAPTGRDVSQMSNTGATAVTPPNATPWSNAQPETIVLVGEAVPVAGIALPTPPTAVDYSTTLVAGTNYLVYAGTRATGVTVNLPDPPALGQQITVADIAGLGVTYPITVNAGTKQIADTGLTSYSVNRNNAVLGLVYTGTKWKII